MSKNNEYENNLEVTFIEISEKEYNERIVRVMKWFLEMSDDSAKLAATTNTTQQEAA